MWPILVPLAALATVLGATVYIRHKENPGFVAASAASAAAAAGAASELKFLTDQALRLASQQPALALTAAQREQDAQIAEKYGMTATAAAFRAGGAWSNTEIWPNTGMSVAAYLSQQWNVSPYNPSRGATA